MSSSAGEWLQLYLKISIPLDCSSGQDGKLQDEATQDFFSGSNLQMPSAAIGSKGPSPKTPSATITRGLRHRWQKLSI